MEGPSVRIVAEELAVFKGKMVKLASGNAKIEKEAVEGKKIEDVFSRGKNLFIKFLDLSFKIHFIPRARIKPKPEILRKDNCQTDVIELWKMCK